MEYRSVLHTITNKYQNIAIKLSTHTTISDFDKMLSIYKQD